MKIRIIKVGMYKGLDHLLPLEVEATASASGKGCEVTGSALTSAGGLYFTGCVSYAFARGAFEVVTEDKE